MKLNEPGQIWKQQLNEPLWMNSSAVQEEMHQTKINSYCTALSSIKNQFLGPHKVMSSQVILQPSDLIILAIIEKATVLSGQKSKAEKTRKGKEGKKKQRERKVIWKSKEEEKHEVQAAQTLTAGPVLS